MRDENIEAVKKMILNKHRITIKEVFINFYGCLNDDLGLFKNVITGNEFRVYSYEIETKRNYPNGSVQKSQDR